MTAGLAHTGPAVISFYMTQKEFDELVREMHLLADSIVNAKRPDYTQGNADVLHNFRQAAEGAGISPLQAWFVHFHKQFSAVAKAAKSPFTPRSEPIANRFADLRNYLDLGYALFAELEGLNTKPSA